MEDEKQSAELPREQENPQPQLGYGHPAHKPDPDATYAFEPGQWRVLPVRKDKRWRVPC